MANHVLPYLKTKAKGGDRDAVDCLQKMADDGDDDAADALNEINPDGNGASPQDQLPFEKGGSLFDADALQRTLADVEPFAKGGEAGEGLDLPPTESFFEAEPEVQAAIAMDAGDFVKSVLAATAQSVDRVGDVAAWSATGVEALAKAQIATGELLERMAKAVEAHAAETARLRTLLESRGAGVRGAQTRPQAGVLNKDFGALAPPSAGGDQVEGVETLRKSLRALRAQTSDRGALEAIGAALEDLTIGNVQRARVLVNNRA